MTATPNAALRPERESEPSQVAELAEDVSRRAPREACAELIRQPDEIVARTLETVNPADAVRILWGMSDGRRRRVMDAASPYWATQWALNHTFPENTIGRLMTPAFAELSPNMTIGAAIETLRDLVKRAFISYVYVIDSERKLLGVLVFRDMMFAHPSQLLSEVMIVDPFAVRATMPVMDAMREIVKMHFPSYPVIDDEGRLVGVIRGQTLFQQQAFELSAQPGAMVGIQKIERLATPWPTSLRFRHPWLQLNLLTAFVAASVVGIFQSTIDQVVALAVFLPVLAGQSGNTGSQALAVTLRGMTLGELRDGSVGRLVAKEAWLGLLNGALVGLTAGLGMFAYAMSEGMESALTLGIVVALAMTGACIASGVSGVIVPVTLRKLGADPATASSIFLTTATDVLSMGLFLGLATLLVT